MMTTTEQTIPTQLAPIQITERDKQRLEDMISEIQRRGVDRDDLTSLLAELQRAQIVDWKYISRNVVTMDSVFSIINLDTSERSKFTLVFPQDADSEQNKISILSPIGSAVLGFQVGDEFEWKVPAGMRRYVIAKVDSQPEASIRKRMQGQ